MNIFAIFLTVVGLCFSFSRGNQLEIALEQAENLLLSLKAQIEELKFKANREIPEELAYPSSCLAAYINTNGIHSIKIPGLSPFQVACETRLAGAGWTIIQRRLDGTENFYRSWSDYREGFGNLNGEFFLGLQRLHYLTNAEPYELYVHLEDFERETHMAKYDRFVIGNESQSFALNQLGAYTGDAGDSLRYHEGKPFSTFDHDPMGERCALFNMGAWWYNMCQHSNLNGQYMEGGPYERKLSGRGICWKTWHGYDYGYKVSQMMIRPKCSNSMQRGKNV